MTANSRKNGYWWALGLGCIIIFAFYGRFIFNANEYLYSNNSDGLTHYYTFAWHINHDSSYTHFRGMNYPFGEHIAYTNSQPAVSSFLRFINLHIIYIGNYAIGIHNLLLFFSLLACIVVLYKLFFELMHSLPIAVAGALVVGMLSPQISLFTHNFALAYCFVIPLYLWWAYRFFNTPNWRTSRAMAVLLLLLLFVHPYYWVLVAALLLALWLLMLIREQPRINILTAIPHIFIQLVVPFAIYVLWLALTDDITDRPANTANISGDTKYWASVLLPLNYTYFAPLKQTFGLQKINAVAYAGFPALLFVLWGIAMGIKRIFKKRTPKNPLYNRQDKPYNQRFMICLLWATAIVFAYTAILPYVLGIPTLTKYLGLPQHYSQLGQLLWVVYYGLTVSTVWYVYQKTKHKIKLSWVPWAVLLVFAIEGTVYNVQTVHSIHTQNTPIGWVPQKVNPDNYQAILPLPFFHQGAEIIQAVPTNDSIVVQSLLLSLQTGIPLQGVKLNNTSLHQTLQQLEMGYEFTTLPQPMLQGTKKPFLLLHDINDSTTLPELENMRPIAQTDGYKLYRFSPKLLDVLLIKRATEIEKQAQMQSNSLYFFNGYDSLQAQHVFSGEGALAKNASQPITLANTTCAYCGDSLAVSFWIYANNTGLHNIKLLVYENGRVLAASVPIAQHIKAINNNWALVEYAYTPKKKIVLLKLIQENASEKEMLYIDNFLVRTAQYNVLQTNTEFIAKNNRIIFQNKP